MEHKELLAQRIADIINVSTRTIQRDINERLAFLPLERNGNKISLCATALGKLTQKDIRNFAQLSGISQLYPNLDSHFITNLLTNAYQSPYLVTGNEFEHNKEKIRQNTKLLEQAITNQKFISFEYKNKAYPLIAPYKLINHNQIWYLAVLDHNANKKLKTFHVANINNLLALQQCYTLCESTLNEINQSNDIYIAPPEAKIEVVLKVSPQVAHYFQRRNILPNQKIDKALETGELIISSKVAYSLQIIPLIKYWMPHLQVISPKEIHQQVIDDIKQFLEKN